MKILYIFGPNLNMLERRDKGIYGLLSFSSLKKDLKDKYKGHKLTFYQSNSEGKLIDKLQKASKFDAVIINAGGYTHTSVSIRDAIEILTNIKVEVHLSDIYNREDFRKLNFIKDVVDKSFYGKQIVSYYEATDYVINLFTNGIN